MWATAAAITRSPPANVSIWWTAGPIGGGFKFKIAEKYPPGPPTDPDKPDGVDPTKDVEDFLNKNTIKFTKEKVVCDKDDIEILQQLQKFK